MHAALSAGKLTAALYDMPCSQYEVFLRSLPLTDQLTPACNLQSQTLKKIPQRLLKPGKKTHASEL
jgi:hypothetical protein